MALFRACRACGRQFRTKLFYVRRGFGKYCSRSCSYESKRKGEIVSCATCGKDIYRKPRLLRLSKSKKYFCSKSCQTQWRNIVFIGPKHANWKHGRQAYRSVLGRAHRQKICEVCKTIDERVLAVHHKDRNRLNNTLENLAWLCHNCHFLVHHYDVGRDRGLLKPRS
jgi:hypothetical protein